jgi:hypothetical protein
MRYFAILPLAMIVLLVACGSSSSSVPAAPTPALGAQNGSASAPKATAVPSATKSAQSNRAVPAPTVGSTAAGSAAKAPVNSPAVPVGEWGAVAEDAEARALSLSVVDVFDFGCHQQQADPGAHFYRLQAEGRFDGPASGPYSFNAVNWHVIGADGQEDVAGDVFTADGFGFNTAADGSAKGEVVFMATGMTALYYQAEPSGPKTWFVAPKAG